jgi:hypothetical protein
VTRNSRLARRQIKAFDTFPLMLVPGTFDAAVQRYVAVINPAHG